MVDLRILFDTWIPLISLLTIIGSALCALGYMLGVFLVSDKIKFWAKSSFFEIIYSLIIVAFALFALQSAENVVTFLAGGDNLTTVTIRTTNGYEAVDLCQEGTFASGYENSPYYYDPVTKKGIPFCHIRMSMYFLNTIFDELNDFGFNTYLSYICTAILADFAINMEFVFEKAGFFTITPQRGFFVIGNNMKSFAFDTAIKLMGVVKFQEILVSFVSQALFPVLFVIGVVLRTFAFSRRLGGLLMAIALVLFFVYPMFYILPGLIVNSIKNEIRATTGIEDPHIADYLAVRGKVPFICGNINLEDEHRAYEDLKGKSDSDFNSELERGITLGIGSERGINPGDVNPSKFNFNLGAAYGGFADEATLEENLNKESTRLMLETYEQINSVNWYDPFVPAAFKPGNILDALGRLAFFSIFFGLLGIIASIAAIRSLSVMLGGDIEIAGLTHLI